MAEQTARFSVARLAADAPEPRPRVLLVGDGDVVMPAAPEAAPQGPGSPSAVPPGLAGLLAASGAHGPGVDVDVLWDLVPALRAVGSGTTTWRLWRYDAVVVVAGGGPLLGAVLLHRLLLRVSAELAGAGRLIVVLAAPADRGAAGRAARRRGTRLQQLLDSLDAGIGTLPAGLDGARRLADPEAVAEALRAVLPPAGPRSAVRPQHEQQRQVAVDRSLAAVQGSVTHLQRAVLLACSSFDVPYAQVNLLDRGRLRGLAFTGRSSDGLADSLSAMAVQQDGPLLIADTRADRRFDRVPETRGPHAIRFYAGHPIRSADGYPIGVLCVLDEQPHPVLEGDEVLLRDVALLAEAELNALTGPPR